MLPNNLFAFGHEILRDPRVKELAPWDRCVFLELLMSPAISPEGVIVVPAGRNRISPPSMSSIGEGDDEKCHEINGSAVNSGFDGKPRSYLSNDSKGSAVAGDILICLSSSVFKREYLNLGVDIDKLPSSLKTKNLVATSIMDGAGYILIIDYLRWSMERLKNSKKSRGEITAYCANADHLTKLPQIHKRLVSTYPDMFPELPQCVCVAPAAPQGFCMDIALRDGTCQTITDKELATYANMFPRLNLKAEFAKIAHWCAMNPSRRKTKQGFGRFVMGWLGRAETSAASRPAARTQNSKPLI